MLYVKEIVQPSVENVGFEALNNSWMCGRIGSCHLVSAAGLAGDKL